MNIFEEAAEVIAEHGLAKGALQVDDSFCAVGALRAVRQSHYDWTNAAEAAQHRLEERGIEAQPGSTTCLLAQWNDLPETTGEDVILLFKELGAEL